MCMLCLEMTGSVPCFLRKKQWIGTQNLELWEVLPFIQSIPEKPGDTTGFLRLNFLFALKKNPKYLIRASALEIWSELGRGYMQDNLSWFTLFSWYIAGVGAITLWNMSLYACSPNGGNAVKVLKICLQMGNDGLLLAPTLTCGQLCVLWQPWYH